MAGIMDSDVQHTFSELAETGFIKCILCKSPYQNPRLLPCLHTFCMKCIEQLKQTQNQSENQSTSVQNCETQSTDGTKSSDNVTIDIKGDDKTDITIVCPICKSTIAITSIETSCPVNVFMKDLCEMHDYKHDKDRVCDYCKFENNVSIATTLCLDCHDNMCEECTTAHNKTKITRGHKVIHYTQVQKGLYDHDIREYQQQICPTHDNEELGLFCLKCEVLMCKVCKVDDHDNHKWEATETAVNKYQAQMKNLLRGIRQQIPAVQNYLQFLSNYNRSIENSRAKYVDSIEKQSEQLHKMIDDQKARFIETLTEASDKEECEIQVKASNLKIAANSLQDNEKFLRNLLDTGKPDEVLLLHRAITKRLTQLMHMQLDGVTSQLKLNFNTGNSSERNVQTIFGKVSIDKVPINQSDQGLASANALQISAILPNVRNTAELITEFDAEGGIDSKEVWPTGIAMTKSDEIVIADRDNKKVKIYTAGGKLKQEIPGKGENKLGSPFDVAVLKSGDIAVTDHEAENVKIFTQTADHVLTIKEGIKYPRGITVNSKGEIIVLDCQLKCLTIHNPKTGAKIKTIEGTDTKGSKVLVDPYYVTVSPQNNLIVTDTAAPNIKVFSPTGQYLANYGHYGMRKDEILQPYGVCCDAYGYIFVADNQNHRIHLLLPDGKFSKFLLTKTDCLWHPMGLAITEKGYLILSEALGKIKIFKYI